MDVRNRCSHDGMFCVSLVSGITWCCLAIRFGPLAGLWELLWEPDSWRKDRWIRSARALLRVVSQLPGRLMEEVVMFLIYQRCFL